MIYKVSFHIMFFLVLLCAFTFCRFRPAFFIYAVDLQNGLLALDCMLVVVAFIFSATFFALLFNGTVFHYFFSCVLFFIPLFSCIYMLSFALMLIL